MKSLTLQYQKNLSMDIQLTKADIIKRFQDVNDESLILAFKNLLDYALSKEETDQLLKASIERGLAQSAKGEVKPHEVVMAGLRQKYKI